MSMPTKQSISRRILRGIFTALLALAMAVVFYLSVIFGTPQGTDAPLATATPQPLLTASPVQTMADLSEMPALLESFPAPVLAPLAGSSLQCVAGTSYDAAFEQGFGRVVVLTCQNSAGLTVTLTSIYPARALTLLPTEGYLLSDKAGNSLAGTRSVRMEHSSGRIRLHAQGSEALYIFETPPVTDVDLAMLSSSLSLYELAPQ